ncbi:Metallo-hydrolase/oxidoreductase [Hesseltinella vesiculosa]|uniref:Metallo-hydrolase/oxidoreductase n=1 Tax=Hesseltinella vesiculosa TaxID=101127 RepID=A0A1X2G3Z8_9FUNG|nr:Metallo-hydrolase/oxidoreductase [Hesseltinella vesiculosa]
MSEALVQLPTFARLSDRVWRVLGLNPGKFTLQGTNTYLLGTGHRKLLLDCGEGIPEYVDLLQTSLQTIAPQAYISDIIISHGHQDHWGGLASILSSAFFKHKGIRVHKFPMDIHTPCSHTTTFSSSTKDHMARFPKDIQVHALADQQLFETDGVTLQAIHTPGHTQDHCTFWLKEEQALFTADCVLGQGTAVFEDLSQYLAGLKKLVSMGPQRLYPGHGPVIEDGRAKIVEYITHREQREQQILDFLRQPPSAAKDFSPLEIVQVLYKNYPTSLHLPAAHSVVLHLLKLEKDGKAAWDRSDAAAQPDLVQSRWHRL